MSNDYVFNDTLPVAPLKIAALESCRDLAEKVNSHIINPSRADLNGTRLLRDAAAPGAPGVRNRRVPARARVSEAVKQKASSMSLSVVPIFTPWSM